MATVVVLAKAPIAGSVKTRLCPPCTVDEAAALAEAALIDTLDLLATVASDRRVIVVDGPVGGWFAGREPMFDLIPQRTGSLDTRLADAFDDVLVSVPGSGEPCVLIAMDTPHAEPTEIEEALRLLITSDAVIGHAEDGGFWLIGLRRPDRRVFEGVPMSTDRTGEAQSQRLRSLGYSVAMVRPMRDIDTTTDLDWLAAAHPGLRSSREWSRQRGHRIVG